MGYSCARRARGSPGARCRAPKPGVSYLTEPLTLRKPTGARRLVAVVLLTVCTQCAMATNLSGFVAGAVDTSPEVREQIHLYREVIQDYESALSGWRPSLDLSTSYGQISRKASNTGQRRRQYDSGEARSPCRRTCSMASTPPIR